jgi:hypothetical protein
MVKQGKSDEDGPHHLAMIGAVNELQKMHETLTTKRWEKEVVNKKADHTVSDSALRPRRLLTQSRLHTNVQREFPVHTAARHGQCATLVMLAERGANIDAQDKRVSQLLAPAVLSFSDSTRESI